MSYLRLRVTINHIEQYGFILHVLDYADILYMITERLRKAKKQT